jgi:hypothetical protein
MCRMKQFHMCREHTRMPGVALRALGVYFMDDVGRVRPVQPTVVGNNYGWSSRRSHVQVAAWATRGSNYLRGWRHSGIWPSRPSADFPELLMLAWPQLCCSCAEDNRQMVGIYWPLSSLAKWQNGFSDMDLKAYTSCKCKRCLTLGNIVWAETPYRPAVCPRGNSSGVFCCPFTNDNLTCTVLHHTIRYHGTALL